MQFTSTTTTALLVACAFAVLNTTVATHQPVDPARLFPHVPVHSGYVADRLGMKLNAELNAAGVTASARSRAVIHNINTPYSVDSTNPEQILRGAVLAVKAQTTLHRKTPILARQYRYKNPLFFMRIVPGKLRGGPCNPRQKRASLAARVFTKYITEAASAKKNILRPPGSNAAIQLAAHEKIFYLRKQWKRFLGKNAALNAANFNGLLRNGIVLFNNARNGDAKTEAKLAAARELLMTELAKFHNGVVTTMQAANHPWIPGTGNVNLKWAAKEVAEFELIIDTEMAEMLMYVDNEAMLTQKYCMAVNPSTITGRFGNFLRSGPTAERMQMAPAPQPIPLPRQPWAPVTKTADQIPGMASFSHLNTAAPTIMRTGSQGDIPINTAPFAPLSVEEVEQQTGKPSAFQRFRAKLPNNPLANFNWGRKKKEEFVPLK